MKHECVECSDWIKDCEFCNNDEPDMITCEECDKSLIPSPLGDGCVARIPNCMDQPEDYLIINREYVCADCGEGMFWNYEKKEC